MLVTIDDTIITIQRAQEILEQILVVCKSLNCKRVLLDESSVETREMHPLDIMALGRDAENVGTKDIYMAVLCQPHLINKDSDLLGLFNYKKQYVVRHFADRNEADSWLSTFRNA